MLKQHKTNCSIPFYSNPWKVGHLLVYSVRTQIQMPLIYNFRFQASFRGVNGPRKKEESKDVTSNRSTVKAKTYPPFGAHASHNRNGSASSRFAFLYIHNASIFIALFFTGTLCASLTFSVCRSCRWKMVRVCTTGTVFVKSLLRRVLLLKVLEIRMKHCQGGTPVYFALPPVCWCMICRLFFVS